jgi:hypothetical protein
MYRCTPEGKMRVFRTLDGGKSWKPLANGLPQKNAHETVLRDALCVDQLNPAGVYVGTRSGKVYASPDGGASWSLVADGLPPVLVVRAAVIGDPAKISVPGGKRAKAAVKAPVKRAVRKAAGRPTASSARKPAKSAAKPAARPKPAAKKKAAASRAR